MAIGNGYALVDISAHTHMLLDQSDRAMVIPLDYDFVTLGDLGKHSVDVARKLQFSDTQGHRILIIARFVYNSHVKPRTGRSRHSVTRRPHLAAQHRHIPQFLLHFPNAAQAQHARNRVPVFRNVKKRRPRQQH